MGREIKFRAWDYEIFQMYDDEQIIIQGGTVFIGRMKCINKISDDVKLMQYTGLKDKNGVEIYEGDIIEFAYGKKLVSEVRHSNMFGYEVANKDNSILGLILVNGICEVVGNIYENNELLNE